MPSTRVKSKQKREKRGTGQVASDISLHSPYNLMVAIIKLFAMLSFPRKNSKERP